jgi:hypothetical protein
MIGLRPGVALIVSCARLALVPANTVKAGRVFTNVLRFMEFSRLVVIGHDLRLTRFVNHCSYYVLI